MKAPDWFAIRDKRGELTPLAVALTTATFLLILAFLAFLASFSR